MRFWPGSVLLAACAVALAAAAAPNPATTILERAEFILTQDAQRPADTAAWEPISLPHRFGSLHQGERSAGWYRIRFTLAEPPRSMQGINLAHFRSRSIDFYVNGMPIGGTRDVVSSGLGLGVPALLPVLPALLRAGENVLHARIVVQDELQGLGRVELGELRRVRHSNRLQNDLGWGALWAFVSMALAAGLIAFFVWWARRQDTVLLWFGIACLSWGLAGMTLNVLRLVDGAPSWLWSMLFTFQAWGLTVPAIVVALRTVGLRWPKLEIALWAFLAVELVHVLVVPPGFATFRRPALDTTNASMLLLGAALIVWYAPRPLRWSIRIEIAALALMALCMLFEVFRYLGWVDLEAIIFRPYHVPVMLLAIGAAIFERHVLAVRAMERSHAELEQRVAEKAREIEAYHAERDAVARRQALLDERSRILADMHDGVGASLVALLRYAQGGRVDAKTVERGAREAMQELRIAIDALEPAEGDLATVLGKLRHRVEPLMSGTPTRLSWEMAELPRVEALEPSAVLAIQRIVLEAISNAVQHAGARNIRLAARALGERAIEVRIEDDGAGYDAARPALGRGLVTMRERARVLRGSFDIASRPGAGTVVTLVLPVSLAAEAQVSEPGRSTFSSAARATAAAAE
jgi:signal transduction histidine kinase